MQASDPSLHHLGDPSDIAQASLWHSFVTASKAMYRKAVLRYVDTITMPVEGLVLAVEPSSFACIHYDRVFATKRAP